MLKDRVYIDFEFCKPNELGMGLISCQLAVDDGKPETYWLHDGSDVDSLVHRLDSLDSKTFVAYNVDMAEGRCVRALGLDPRKFKWNDLYLDWKWLRNGDDQYTYGDVISSDYKTSWSIKPVAKITKRMTKEEEEDAKRENREACRSEARLCGKPVSNLEAGFGLLDAEYFFGVIDSDDVIADKEEKARVRDGIIVANRDNPEVIEANKQVILEYGVSDISRMRDLDNAIHHEMLSVGSQRHLFVMDGEVLQCSPNQIKPINEIRDMMGHWAAQLAMYSARGIPLHRGKYEAVKAAVPKILTDTQMQWNVTHPEDPIYRIGKNNRMILSKKKQMLKRSPYKDPVITKDSDLIEDMISRYCDTNDVEWRKTAAGSYSLDSNYLKEMDDGGLIHEYKKHTEIMSSIKAMAVQDDGSVKLDASIGSDSRQRPYFGPFGTKTGRNATKASTFIFLGPKWFRIMVSPKEGTYVCDLDAHSEEVAIAAALYDDENKRKVYRSADVYMMYAQLAGAYPQDKPILTEDQRETEKWFREEHWDRVRKNYKSGFLGMQFGMGANSLQRRVSASLPPAERDKLPSDFGERFVDEYHDTFAQEFACVNELKTQYKRGFVSGIVLADGWRIGPDDPNILSIGNFPVQGTGAVILRRACTLCDEAGVRIYATLHDAISITGKVENMESDIKKATDAFKQAADEVLGESLMLVGNPEVVKHGEAWLHSSDAKDQWNAMATKYFEEYTID
jgi:hypothetical protein